MEQKFGFTKMTLSEFVDWINTLKVSRTILKIQHHHTYSPSYRHFNNSNHFERQKAMRDHHIKMNGWGDIGQHLTIFPDGSILTGRSVEMSPACIYGQNANSFCIENFGNFDKQADVMTSAQKDAIVGVTAALCQRFNLLINSSTIIYHHWYDLSSGIRNNGTKNNKSCPGTNFFGGNKVADCERNFLPLVQQKSTDTQQHPIPTRYAYVTANQLNVRTAPSASSPKATQISLGAILRVYAEKSGWLKISNSSERWVSEKHTIPVEKAIVTASSLNIRSGPATTFAINGKLTKADVVFISERENGWSLLESEDGWVSSKYLEVEK